MQPEQQSFLIRMPRRELWRLSDPSERAAHADGFRMTAFTPYGAALKLYNAGIISGLKNYEAVNEGDGTISSFYPPPISKEILLDDPTATYLFPDIEQATAEPARPDELSYTSCRSRTLKALELARQSSFQVTDFGFAIRAGAPLEQGYAVLQEGRLRVAKITQIVELQDGTRYVTGTIVDDAMGIAEHLQRAPFLEIGNPAN